MSHQRSVMLISPAAMFSQSQPSPTTITLYLYDPEGPFPSEEDNNVVVEPISLDIRHSIECYVLDAVDPLTQSTHLGIDLHIHALNLVRDRME